MKASDEQDQGDWVGAAAARRALGKLPVRTGFFGAPKMYSDEPAVDLDKYDEPIGMENRCW